MKNKTLKNKQVILRGEGLNEHVLYGDFKIENEETDFSTIHVSKEGVLQHEDPSGKFAEHYTLPLKKGIWAQGRQVEYNPFNESIQNVWD